MMKNTHTPAPLPTYRVVLTERANAYWWNLKAANGATLSYSELFVSKRNALATARKVAAALGTTVEMEGPTAGGLEAWLGHVG